MLQGHGGGRDPAAGEAVGVRWTGLLEPFGQRNPVRRPPWVDVDLDYVGDLLGSAVLLEAWPRMEGREAGWDLEYGDGQYNECWTVIWTWTRKMNAGLDLFERG